MASIHLEVELTPEQILKAAKQLAPRELEWLTNQVIALHPVVDWQRLSPAESDLLLKINQGVPTDLQQRYDELIEKRQDESLTAAEHQELLQLTDQVEMFDAKRLEYLLQLANLRQKPLPLLMQELGIQAAPYV